MNQTKRFWIRWAGIGLLGLLLVAALAACGGEQPTQVAQATTAAPAPTEAPTEPPTEAPTATTAPTEPPPTATEVPPTETPTTEPTPSDTPTPEVVDDSACITCHTDEATLQALAEEEEAPEVESEGEG
jgi:hypothetical protein